MMMMMMMLVDASSDDNDDDDDVQIVFEGIFLRIVFQEHHYLSLFLVAAGVTTGIFFFAPTDQYTPFLRKAMVDVRS